MRTFRVALMALGSALLLLWACSYFLSVQITFGIPPYYYHVETTCGAVWVHRSFCCLQSSAPHVNVDPQDKEDFKAWIGGWERASEIEDHLGLMTWHMSFPLSSEATA